MTEYRHRSAAGSFLTRFLRRKLNSIAPRRIKRLFFIGSIICLMLKDRSPAMELLAQINKEMRLAYTPTGLLFPVYMGYSHWDDFNFDKITLDIEGVRSKVTDLEWMITDHDLWVVARFFATHTPDWLIYGSVDLITTDAHAVLKIIKMQGESP